jgi:hypothetical protein
MGGSKWDLVPLKIDFICIRYIYKYEKTTYDALYFIFLLGFIIVAANLSSIQRQNYYKKYNIKPLLKSNPIQIIKDVLENPLPIVLILMIFFAIDSICKRWGVSGGLIL